MKKTWMNPELEALNINETAFGPFDPHNFDGEYTEVKDSNGNTIGYQHPAGAATLSSNN